MATNPMPVPDIGAQAKPNPVQANPQSLKNEDGTNLDGTVTITVNKQLFAGEVGFLAPGDPRNVSVAYADTMQDAWNLASRSDDPNFKDPSTLPNNQAVAVARTNWEAKNKRKGK